jgi:LuxR family maltose regulon positive regulatory protein
MMTARTQRQALQLVRQPAAVPSFDVRASKLRVPTPRAGSVFRTALVNRLRAARPGTVISLVAPAGYGKTTVLAQWAERDERRFAWLSLDEHDDEPRALLRHLVAALHQIEELPPTVLEALQDSPDSYWTSALPRLTEALRLFRTRCVIVLDNASLVRSPAGADVLSAVVDDMPAGWALVVAGRAPPSLPLGTLRAEGRLLEVGPELLALAPREAEQLVRAVAPDLASADGDALLTRSEGWAAGLYLGALALVESGDAEFGGDDRYLREYFRASSLSSLDEGALTFLRRSSVLDWLSGPLCDATLARTGSAPDLESLQRDGFFVEPLDRRRKRYRYHPLFRDFLQRELDDHDPGAAAELNVRAAEWLESAGENEDALVHAAAAGDVERTVRLITSVGISALDRGDLASVERCVELLPHTSSGPDPVVAVVASLAHAASGHAERAAHWLAAAERRADEAGAEVAVARAASCSRGPHEMAADARHALAELPADSPWSPRAHFLAGVAALLLGDIDGAADAVGAAARAAEQYGSSRVLTVALAQQALLALRLDDHALATAAASEARALAADTTEDTTAILVHAAAARVLLRQSRFDEARAELEAARRLEPLLTHALPWLAVGARLELARAYLTLRDAAAASELLRGAAAVQRLLRDLGILEGERVALEAAVLAAEPGAANTSGLTNAELRLLPLLATHLSFREIGTRLYLSRHTVKTQAISLYRKLGVSSRSEAMQIAKELGLLA